MLYNATGEKLNKNDSFINSIDVEYGRLNNAASYYFCRIPKYDIDGVKHTPKVAIPSSDGKTTTSKMSVLDYAKANDIPFCINAGLFSLHQNNDRPLGQLIIDGKDESYYHSVNGSSVAYMTDDMGTPLGNTECYPLLINANGDLSCTSTDRTANANTPTALINSGYKYAVVGWGMIVNNYQDAHLEDYEIIHQGKYVRQLIGQYQNGDYCVMLVTKKGYSISANNEGGASYSELATFLIEEKGVKFAYALDGGGSAQIVIGKRSVAPILEQTTGRAVGSVIAWI